MQYFILTVNQDPSLQLMGLDYMRTNRYNL